MISERDSPPNETNSRLFIVGDGTCEIAGPPPPQHPGASGRQDTASRRFLSLRGPGPVATGADPADHGAVAA